MQWKLFLTFSSFNGTNSWYYMLLTFKFHKAIRELLRNVQTYHFFSYKKVEMQKFYQLLIKFKYFNC